MHTIRLSEQEIGILSPPHKNLIDHIESIVRAFEGELAFDAVTHVEYLGKTGQLKVHFFKRTLKSARLKHKTALRHSFSKAWSEYPTFYESDIWEEIINTKIKPQEMRDWVARTIWWNRHEGTKGDYRKKWDKFIEKHDGFFHPSIDVLSKLIRKHLTASEWDKVLIDKKFEAMGVSKMINRKAATRAIAEYERNTLRRYLNIVEFAA